MPPTGLGVRPTIINKNSRLISETRAHGSRGTTLFPEKQALTGTAHRYIPCLRNGRLPACLLAHAFSSRLREDFQPFPLTRFTLFPGSLSAVRGVLVPIIAIRFQDAPNYAIKTADGQGLRLLVYWTGAHAQEIPMKYIALVACLLHLIGCSLISIIMSHKSLAAPVSQADIFTANPRLRRTVNLGDALEAHNEGE